MWQECWEFPKTLENSKSQSSVLPSWKWFLYIHVDINLHLTLPTLPTSNILLLFLINLFKYLQIKVFFADQVLTTILELKNEEKTTCFKYSQIWDRSETPTFF